MPKDTETEPAAHEILVGGTNRGVGVEISDPDSYLVALTDGKLTVRGGAPGTTWHAVDAIAEWLEKQRAAGTQEPDFASGSRLHGSYSLKKIACVGDSITHGSGSSDPVLFSYPSVLGRILWQECLVYNFGHGSRTVRDDAERYNRDLGGIENCGYRNSNTYKRLMASTVRFDLVLLMLGTNDSYLVPGDWTAADDAKFLSCLRGLADDLRGHSRNAEIVLMNCPTYYGSSGWSKPHTRDPAKALCRADGCGRLPSPALQYVPVYRTEDGEPDVCGRTSPEQPGLCRHGRGGLGVGACGFGGRAESVSDPAQITIGE